MALAGSVAPFISAGRYGARIQQSLEASLGRKVSIGKAHFTLFAGPGFSIEDVAIGEDPRYGIEPCAYVPLLEARVRLDKLLEGRIQFAELRLEGAGGIEPTLNLVKRNDGTWNVVELIERLGREGVGYWNFLPALEIGGARLNFKLGDKKSTFYVDDADIAAYLEAPGKVRIRFEGSPSRTDRSGPGFAAFKGDANWYLKPTASKPNQLEADLDLEQSNLSEMITLVEGYDIGIHGTVSSHLEISGPADALHVHGDLRLEDVHRWDLMPSSGEYWNVHFGGVIDLANNRIQFETEPADTRKVAPAVLQVRVNDFLTAPYWSILALLRNAPAENLLPLGRRLGLGLPDGLSVKGLVNGAVGYSSRSGWNGSASLEEVTATIPDLPAFKAPSTTLSIAPDRVHVAPSLIESPAGSALLISGDYVPSTRRLGINLNAQGASLSSLTAALSSWFGKPPVLTAFESGTVTGQLRYLSSPPEEPAWSGEFQITKGSLEPPGFALPVRDFTARFLLAGNQLDVPRFSATLAGHVVAGEYHYNLDAARKERLRVQTAEVDLADLEKVLGPTLGPRDFFSRFRFGHRSTPAWLANRNIEADFAVSDLSIAGNDLGPAKGRCLWLGAAVEVPSIRAQLAEGEIEAQGSISLLDARPRYSFSGRASGLAWKGGRLDVHGLVTTAGFGEDLLRNLQSTGAFEGTDLNPSQDVNFSAVTGNYTLSFDSGWPRLQLTELSAEQAEEAWQGTGSSDKDGGLVLDLTDGARQLHVVSTLDPSIKAGTPVANSAAGIH